MYNPNDITIAQFDLPGYLLVETHHYVVKLPRFTRIDNVSPVSEIQLIILRLLSTLLELLCLCLNEALIIGIHNAVWYVYFEFLIRFRVVQYEFVLHLSTD